MTSREPRRRDRVRVKAPAKVNLHLEVLKRRHDGYHEIETILQAVDLCDLLQVTLLERRDRGAPEVELLVRPDGSAPDDESNLAVQAARLFCRELRVSGHLAIEIDKEIPAGAGLGGGSSDAMAVLVACDHLFATGLDQAALERMGARLGSDVPFFAAGGTQLGRGRGTELTRLSTPRQARFVILKPGFEVRTENAYGALKMGLTVRAPAANLQVIKPLLAKFPARPWFGFNRLEDVILPAHPELSRILLRLRDQVPVAMLSGSGSAVFGVVDSAEQADRLLREFIPSVEFARSVGSLPCGVKLLEG
jgi:4-diphosphocytidyl-2-C-methyl-D-erythritol kinase